MMRRRALAAWGSLALAFVLGWIGRAADSDAVYFFSGLFFLIAAGLAVSLLPIWGGLRERVPPMPGLFPRVPRGRWDPVHGQARRRHK